MARDIAADIRLDPRVKAFLAHDDSPPEGDVDSRETLLAEANSEQARAGAEEFRRYMERFDTKEAAPSAGLRIHTEKVVSQPDGNTINLQVTRPDNDMTVPCVYYIHGGGMGYLSCFDGMFRGWGKLIAANGVAVVMVDFRNAVVPSSVPEVAPFPAGLNDCVSAAGVPARCRQVMGTTHAVETFTTVCPEISRDTARDLAAFCANS
jgi:acetyl esterase/lipase